MIESKKRRFGLHSAHTLKTVMGKPDEEEHCCFVPWNGI